MTIGAKIAKKRRIRHVEIPANAVPWLSLIPDRAGQVTRNDHFNDYQKRFRELQCLRSTIRSRSSLISSQGFAPSTRPSFSKVASEGAAG